MAFEKCLLLASQLTSTLYKDDLGYGWKSLSSVAMNDLVKKGNDNTHIYKSVINALKYTTDKRGAIIEVRLNQEGKETYEVGQNSKQYRFAEDFISNRFQSYKLQHHDCIKNRRKYLQQRFQAGLNNPIFKNLIELYPFITLPTVEELLLNAQDLVHNNHTSKKGKLLTFLNKKSESYYSNSQNRSFVEHNIERFRDLTGNGFFLPVIGNEKSGGRVVDCFNLMPSWIRNRVKIEGEEIVEVDYRALHPNIALDLYGGETKFLTHQRVADSLGVSLRDVKIEHLSFFNKNPEHMKISPLYSYYQATESYMLENMIKDKREYGYKITSRKMFVKEVEIMTECIKRLNEDGIYVIYVYDALYCKKSQENRVKEIMNAVILEQGVYTNVAH